MRSLLTHDLRADRKQILDHRSSAYLALVDLESYPAFVGGKLDYLDMVQHLCRQMEALTATMWEVPDALLRLKFLLTEDHREGDLLYQSGHRVVAGGCVRSYGQLCLASHDRLLSACARQRRRPLLHHRRSADARSPRLLLVPSGIYGITVFSGSSASRWDGVTDKVDYTVILRHSPHPAPRLHPIRLPGLVSPTSRPVENPSAREKVNLIPFVNSIPSFCHLQ